MVKSSSCFKLITCGGGADSADTDASNYQPLSEVKDANDKRGWSFRKRSARHRVLSNTVVTETPSSANKESSECTSKNFQPVPAEPNVVEKIHTTSVSDEKGQLPSLESSQIPEKIVTETKNMVDDDPNPPESDVIIIQAAIRGCLARGALLKSKNVVKLQAAFRGHLVRRHAVGTLRCVQAIVKMQLLVRARRAQQGNVNHVTHTSMEKITSNKFARQLLESTPKNKPIGVKCDPSKSDSAWKWLERWMSVSAADSAYNVKPVGMSEQSDKTKENTSVSQLEMDIQTEVDLQSPDSRELPPASEDEDKRTTYDANNYNYEANHSTSFITDVLEEIPEKTSINDDKGTATEIGSFQNGKMETDESAPEECGPIDQKPEIDTADKQSMNQVDLDLLETEGKKLVQGTRKSNNPAFIAVQSRFEELTSMANSSKSSSLSNQDAPLESQADTSSTAAVTAHRSKEFFSSENSANYPFITVGSSECERIDNPESKIDCGLDPNAVQTTQTNNVSNSDLGQLVITDDTSNNVVHPGLVGNSQEVGIKPEQNASDLLREPEEAIQQDSKLSPEASPISQQYQLRTPSSQVSMSIPDSQGTPSSQVSIKPKEKKTNKSGSGNKRKILSSGNKSPASANHDSDTRGSREQQPKDQPSGKRRSSFGSAKSDQIEQEARDNSSNNSSIPHFMQATESARAKMNANNSPRSSPDVHDQDVHLKKRHSLPGATGRQDSPRINRSPQSSTKGNGVHLQHERKWQR
ncbi:hypothetical protein PIB30_041590 [Stylosanthes scabra]|uniref:DUF4005 domain-containing protein n=1 Tax=Stylosanthes scabra TaxID=79078 RepID=A0ABU6TFM7_9FABA|nr:hypothetical protein [Stylosanthes scabra]